MILSSQFISLAQFHPSRYAIYSVSSEDNNRCSSKATNNPSALLGNLDINLSKHTSSRKPTTFEKLGDFFNNLSDLSISRTLYQGITPFSMLYINQIRCLTNMLIVFNFIAFKQNETPNFNFLSDDLNNPNIPPNISSRSSKKP